MTQSPRKAGIRLPWSHEESGAEDTAQDQAATVDATVPGVEFQSAGSAPDPAAVPLSAAGATEPPLSPESRALLESLVAAMREVAERERESSLSELRASVEEMVESQRTRSAEAGEELRRRADADIEGIHDWVRSENARIATEGERKVEARQAQLTQQLADHEQRSQHDVDQMQSRVADYERQLAAFFAQLNEIDDPAAFGAAAKRMPRPPALAPKPAQPAPAAISETVAGPADAAEAVPTAEPSAEVADVAQAPEASASGAAEAEFAAPPQPAPPQPALPEPALPEPALPEPALLEPAPDAEDTMEHRLAALGIDRNGSHDAVDAVSETEAVETTGEGGPAESFADRLHELEVPGPEAHASEPATATVVNPEAGGEVATAIVVQGLGSFGAITSFKQALERVDGVHGISLSLGPTGEFVYRATHNAGFDLVAAIEQIESGAAQIERQADGSLRVAVRRAR
jgi:hypothetical protein